MYPIDNDLITYIIKKLPLSEQYNAAISLFSTDDDHMQIFINDKNFIKNIDYVASYEFDGNVSIKTKIYNLPLNFNHKKISFHKISEWQKLYNTGHVGPYSLMFTKNGNTICKNHLEYTFTIDITIQSVNVNEFKIALKYVSYDIYNEEVLSGKLIKHFNIDCIPNIFLISNDPIKQQASNSYLNYIVYKQEKNNSSFIRYSNDYSYDTMYEIGKDIGMSSDQLKALLMCNVKP